MAMRFILFRLAAAIAVVSTPFSLSASAEHFELPLINSSADSPINQSFVGLELGPHCASHTSCEDCGGALHDLCHWCAKTNTCHTKGDPFGCLMGSSCDNNSNSTKPPSPPPTPHPTKKKCIDFKDCQSCANSSWECHWCPQNEGSCHPLGSWSGCATGADCFAIDRCQRMEPERVDTGGLFSKDTVEGVGPVVTTVLAVLMGLVLCCATCCFAGVTFVKGAVDDLVRREEVDDTDEDGMNDQYYEDHDEDVNLETPLLLENGSAGETDGEAIANANRRIPPEPLSGPVSVTQLSAMSVTTTNRHHRPTTKKSSMKRMYGVCQVVYLLTIVSTILLFLVGMSYAPRQPIYNVCTNRLGWKSIIEGMASLKVSASFDLLISVYNPNRVEVDLKNGGGQFHYDGEYIGSFEIPEGKIVQEAISDIIVKVTFTPDKWQALQLTAAYYWGTLRFMVGGHAHVSVPAFGNYSFEAKFDDIEVNPNDPTLDDTHLCACPGWKKPV